MAGDLKVWKGTDVPVGQNLKFERKGGWFITKAQTGLAALFMVLLIIAAILLTKYFTEESLKAKDSEAEKSSTLLEENIHPISYELLFNHDSDRFTGEMSLLFELENSTSEIILKFDGDSVSSSHLEFLNSSSNITSEIAIESMEYNKEESAVRIVPSEILTAGKQFNLTLKYLGNINAEEKGVFKIPYKYPVNESKLEDRWIIGATMAPKYCSLVFPCLGNITDRSIFRVKILRQKDMTTISNVFQKAVRDVPEFPGLQMDDYEWSPSMPQSALSYFILPDYQVTTIQGAGAGLNIWYPPHLASTATSIADAAVSLMTFYSDFFNSSLPFQRLSIVVIDGLVADHPTPFGVIPISSNLLYSPEQETFKREEKLFYYLGRKLSNQWLGNLVKFKSLNDSWLEEGLALYMADLAASHKFLSYDASTFVTLVQEKALQEEKFINSKHFYAMSDSLASCYDDIYSSYKGAFIFNMLSAIIQPASFRQGLQLYTEKWKFNNTEPADLWECFNVVQDKIDVAKFVMSWNKKGYPIVSVDYVNGTISLEQAPVSGEQASLWWLPITYTSQGEFDFDHSNIRAWLKEEKSSVINSGLNGSWIIVNPNYQGFFRTNYSKSLMTKIKHALLNESISLPSTVSAELLDDSFSLASYSLLDYGIPLNLSLYLQQETEITPWLTVMKHLNYISIFMEQNTTEYENFKVYLEKQIKNIFSVLGYSSVSKEKPVMKYLRANVLQWSCQHELSNGCSKWAKESFEKWFNQSNMAGNIKILSPELRRTAYCFGNRFYSQNSSTKLLNLSRTNIEEPYEEFNILSALACTSDIGELDQILMQTLDVSDKFFSAKRTIEVWLSLKDISSNSLHAFELVKNEWASILEKFKRESNILGAILEGSTSKLTEESHLEDLKKLRAAVDSSNGDNVETILNNAIERVEFNVNWRKNNLQSVNQWFNNFKNQTL